MISVENFYFVLFHTLLKPVGLDCTYFYPFGTVDNFMQWQFSTHPSISPASLEQMPAALRLTSRVVFHFDQEPIYEESENTIFDITCGSHSKRLRILANSEISDIKRRFCRRHHLGDWYFFFHGFAALDWYRDLAYIDHDEGFTHAFLSFNHLVTHRRSYRMALTARLIQRGILQDGLISFHGSRKDCETELQNVHSALTPKDKFLIQRFLLPSSIPFTVDVTHADGSLSARLGHAEYRTRQKGLFHVVNESVFFENKLHLTEKVFQPITVMRPFVLVAAPGSLQFLRRYGFRTFGDWIDESYDNIQDPVARLDAVADVLQHLAGLSRSDLDRMWADMQGTLRHNKRHFFGDFRHQIVDEMVANFDACIRIWNNGRVDGRDLPLHPDLDRAREILLR